MKTTFLVLAGIASVVFGQPEYYAPRLVKCPPASIVRRTGDPRDGSQTLDEREQSYIDKRRSKSVPLWNEYLEDAASGSLGYNVSALANAGLPTFGISFSGGGYRSALFGAGILAAFEKHRNPALGISHLADYFSGTSGGSWLITSSILFDMIDHYSLVLGDDKQSGWMTDLDPFTPGGFWGVWSSIQYTRHLMEDVQAKLKFPTSITDFWSRAVSYHFFNSTTRENFFKQGNHDQGLRFSDLANTRLFKIHQAPFPIVSITNRVNVSASTSTLNHQDAIPLENTVFEATPFTFGSYEPRLRATIPIEFMGTYIHNGVYDNSTSCVDNFDNAGFILGCSSGVFVAAQNFLTQGIIAFGSGISQLLILLRGGVERITLVGNVPNSFHGISSFESGRNEILQLADGGFSGENVPIIPLLVKPRKLDTVIVVDASGNNDDNYPNGRNLIVAKRRIKLFPLGWASMPSFPLEESEFERQGLAKRPTFFGCYNVVDTPMVIFLANRATAFKTNHETFKSTYSRKEAEAMLGGGFAVATQGYAPSGQPRDSQWPLCLKCALAERARQRAKIPLSDTCRSCFNRYCWSPEA